MNWCCATAIIVDVLLLRCKNNNNHHHRSTSIRRRIAAYTCVYARVRLCGKCHSFQFHFILFSFTYRFFLLSFQIKINRLMNLLSLTHMNTHAHTFYAFLPLRFIRVLLFFLFCSSSVRVQMPFNLIWISEWIRIERNNDDNEYSIIPD